MNTELHKVLADWGEAGSNGRDLAAPRSRATRHDVCLLCDHALAAGGNFSPAISGQQSIGLSGSSYTWASTTQMVADVQAWLDNPSTAYGWLLKGNESSRSSHVFASREATNATQRPTLTIDYTPPAASTISISDVTLAEGTAGRRMPSST